MICFALFTVVLSLFADPVYKLQTQKTATGYEGSFVLESGKGPYGTDTRDLAFEVYEETENRLHFRIYDKTKAIPVIPDVIRQPEVEKAAENPNYQILFAEDGFFIKRKDSDDVIFDCRSKNVHNHLVYEERFVQFSTTVSENPTIYGLGQRRTRFALPYPFKYVLSNQDRNTPGDGSNHYGSHPFHIELRKDGKAHGIFFCNIAPMQVELTSGELTYRVLAGILDFYIFLGPTPREVVEQYTELIGRPCLVPQWVLGLHQCAWGYRNLSVVQNVVETYKKEGIPLDTMWIDIDYMDQFKLFTTDPRNFPQLDFSAFLNKIRLEDNIHSVVIVDPGVHIDDTLQYKPYKDLLDSGMYIQDIWNGPLVGFVWAGKSLFPDYTHPNISSYWTEWVHKFMSEIVPVDGIWNDMNEISNFCDGLCDADKSTATAWYLHSGDSGELYVDLIHNESDTETYNKYKDYLQRRSELPPPMSEFEWLPADYMQASSIPLDSRQFLGPYWQYHNLYAHLQNIATAPAIRRAVTERMLQEQEKKMGVSQKKGKYSTTLTLTPTDTIRPFILSRASFSGSGHTNCVWLGDNHATWSDLTDSISGVLTMSLFGIPVCGCDVGGFSDPSNGELLTRWTQLGAFLYPFFRVHTALSEPSHELYHFGEPYTSINKEFVKERQRLQSYWYTLLHRAHDYGTPLTRSLSMEYPTDPHTHAIDTQAFLGPALLVSPVLSPNATHTSPIYFPPHTRWYNYWSEKEEKQLEEWEKTEGVTTTIPVTLRTFPVHIRGGCIFTKQSLTAATSEAVRAAPLTVVAALDQTQSAEGEVVADDGYTEKKNARTVVHYTISPLTGEEEDARTLVFTANAQESNYATPQTVEEIRVLGVKNLIESVKDNTSDSQLRWSFDRKTSILSIKPRDDGAWKLTDSISIYIKYSSYSPKQEL